MRSLRKPTTLVLATLLLSAPGLALAAATDHVVSATDIERALQQRTQADAQRARIRGLLRRPEVRELAARSGLDIKSAESAVGVLEGEELTRLADRALAAEQSLAGGGSTITISTVTLLLIIIIIILLAK